MILSSPLMAHARYLESSGGHQTGTKKHQQEASEGAGRCQCCCARAGPGNATPIGVGVSCLLSSHQTMALLLLPLLPLLQLAVAPATSIESGGLAVTVDAAAGTYSVSVDSAEWLASGSPPNHLGRPLTLLDVARRSGSDDKLGAFDAVTVRWALANSSAAAGAAAVLHTEVKAYTSSQAGEMLAFTQTWPLGVANTSTFYNQSTAQNEALGRFPAFRVGNATSSTSSASPGTALNWFAFQGCQLQFTGFGRWAAAGAGHFFGGGAQTSMPLVLCVLM